jgi:molybdenum cofactor cytidylyltransferase
MYRHGASPHTVGANRRAWIASAAMTAGLILAAGAGTRFGTTPKQLADLHGRPLLQWAVDAQTAVAAELLDPIVVVLGAHARAVTEAIGFGRARPVVCAGWECGQATSLRCGLQALTQMAGDDHDGSVLVTLGDAPLVSAAVIARFAGAPPGTRAVYGGRPGHPVLLGPAHVRALMDATGDEGARRLLRGGPTVEIGHLCSGRDVDTPEDLEEVRDEARAVV